jgi:uncharacterized RDD family membrane protein YckC
VAPKDMSSHIGRVSTSTPRDEAFVAQPVEPITLTEPIEVQPTAGGAEAGPREADLAPVPFWRRVVAFALDSLVVITVQMSLTIAGLLWYIESSRTFTDDGRTITDTKYVGPAPWGRDFAPLFTFIALAFIYEVIFIWKRGQTPGKERMKIRVTRVDDGELPTFKQACLRSGVIGLFRTVPGGIMLIGNLVALVSGVPAPFNMRRRALHDYAAGTMVVHYDAVEKEGPVRNPRKSRGMMIDPMRRYVSGVTGRDDER